MHENDIGKITLDLCFDIHKNLGPGLLESVYQRVLVAELRKVGLESREEVPIPVEYAGIHFDIAYRADILIENKVLLELKSVERIQKVHHKVALTYLRLGKFKLGFLINFGETLMKHGISRIVNRLEE